jgi:hypothetical protein
MSSLLAVAIVLLVIVVGLTLLQRRAQVNPQAVRRETPSSAQPPPEPPATAPGTETDIRTDPVLGVIGFNDGTWMTETDLVLGDSLVLVEVHGTIDGPTDTDRQIVEAALAQPDLDARARALVIAELERRREDANDVVMYSLVVRPDDTGVRHGFLWYDAPEFIGEIGVKSSDRWRTLTLEVVA